MKKIILAFTILFALSNSLFAQSQRPIVSGINTSASSKKIVVSWKLPEKTEGSHITSLLIYRRNRPFNSTKDLDNLKPLAKLSSQAETFADTPEDYSEYFYAVISVTGEGSWTGSDLYYDEELDAKPEEKDGKPFYIILPGVNTTSEGTKLKRYSKKEAQPTVQENTRKNEYKDGQLREQPLPYIDVLNSQTEKESTISKDSENAALSLLGKNSSSAKKTLDMYIFEDDLISPSGGDDYLLFEVLRKSFIKEDFKLAESELKKFLAQNRSENASNRANFYLGESYYFTGKYASALSCFLLVEDEYPVLANRWIESTLNLFEKEN
ncbi:hypothetical protein [Treponema sp.]|uniref:tetratricopeptide repeat protein n=1 Tax=Treponema sp. TaxID=166 RepID=UPI0025FA3519|nr:hypothetical protein [Treponema sp.]MCR5219132.1 hypothetical protein [Treponema sp.]